MPQINDTTGNIKTSTVLRIDNKVENVERYNIPRGSVDIIEGGLMVRNSSGKAAKPNHAGGNIVDNTVYLNFANPSAGSTFDKLVWNEVGGTVLQTNLEGGGYVGIGGAGVRLGLPLTERFFVKADLTLIGTPGTKLILKRETDSGAERYNEIKLGAVARGTSLPSATNDVGALCFGTIDAVDGNVVWFLFSNVGFVTV